MKKKRKLGGRMDYFLTDEQLEIKEIARKVAEERIKPVICPPEMPAI